MGEFESLDENINNLPCVCMYCGRYCNDTGHSKHVSGLNKSGPKEAILHGNCPECLQEHLPAVHSSLLKEEKIVGQKKSMPIVRMPRECFFIVNNIGHLSGDYDREQRL